MPVYLVLHGYYQSADIIAKKLKGFFGANTTLIIPNGPLKVDDDKYGWFPLDKIDLQNGLVTIDESDIEKLLAYDFGFIPKLDCEQSDNITEQRSVIKLDGIIAFSQGCLAAAALLGACKITSSKLLLFSPIPGPELWKYTIPDTVQCELYIGTEDDLVIPEHSLRFLPLIGHNNVKVIKHRWGHVIPSTGEYKSRYRAFLNHSD